MQKMPSSKPSSSHTAITKQPVVFISYSHDSARHRERVRALSLRLRGDYGCDCRIDLDAEGRVASWPRWMRRQIAEADLVLMIFTRTYRRRFDGDEKSGRGRGATWEASIIFNLLYAAAAGAELLKFVPVVFEADDAHHVPEDVFSGTIYQLPRDWVRLGRCLELNAGRKAEPAQTTFASGKIVDSAPLQEHARALSVLFVGAQRGTGLNLRGQLAATRTSIARAKYGTSVRLRGLFNITPEQMLMELGNQCPDVLHLSGKQEGGQIKMHNVQGDLTPVSAERLAGLFTQFSALRLVILDTCWSLPQAHQIVRVVDAAVGVAAAIAEPVATDFFALFFNALANGSSVRQSHRLAFGLQMAKIEGDPRYRRKIEKILECEFDPKMHLPCLVMRPGVDGDQLILADGGV